MSAFVRFLDTLFVSRDYTRMFSAAENKAISDVRRGRADIMSIPEKVLTNLRSHIEMVSGGSAVAAFDMWLARAYVAHNLRPYQNRLAGHHIHHKALHGWLNESRSMSPGSVDRVFNILGFRADERPVTKDVESPSVRMNRYDSLCGEFQTVDALERVEELEIELQYLPEDFAVRLCAGKNSVEICVIDDDDEFLDVTDGGQSFPDDSYSDYAKAIEHAFELIAEYRDEDKVNTQERQELEKVYDTLEALVRKRMRARQIKTILQKAEFSQENLTIRLLNVDHDVDLSGELHVYSGNQGVAILASFYKGKEKVSQEVFTHLTSAFNFVLDLVADTLVEDDDEDDADDEDDEEDTPREAFKKRTDELVATLRNIDPDDHINYSGHKITHQADDQWMINLLDADKVKGLRIVAYRDRPADKLFSLNEGTICIGNYPDVKSLLEAAMNRFLAMWEEDDEDDVDDGDEVSPRNHTNKPKKKAKKAELYSDDEEDTSALSKFAQKRCAGLAKFTEYRQTLMEDADGDEEDLSSLYGELRRISTHPLVHIMAAYWPKSFRFTLVSADEEAPIFNFFCNSFDITINNDRIEIVEFIDGATDDDTTADVNGKNEADGSLTYRVYVPTTMTTMQRMNRVMKYFSTWNEARMNALLMQSGFEFDDGETEGLCVGSESVNILPFVGVPSTFFNEEDRHHDQIQMDGACFTLEDFLRDECYNLRGAHFEHKTGPTYNFEISTLQMSLLSVAGGTVAHDHILLVAESNSANAFYHALQNELITLDWLRKKCIVVEEKSEYISLEFKVDTQAYVVHVYR